jgi:peptidyl-tRNA hydrolase
MQKDSAIVRSISGIQVSQRSIDGYVNATQLLKAHQAKTGENQKLSKWLETDRSKAYVDAVSKRCKISPFDLVQVKSGKGGGSWIHPDLAVPFATWLSIEFEMQVSDWIQEWMKTGQNPIVPQLTREEIIASLMPSQPLTWECRYKPEFWQRLEDLYGYRQGNPACAMWINKFVYGHFPQDVRDRLDEINPLIGGKRKNLQHCHFDGDLLKSLEVHLALVFAFLNAAQTATDFERSMAANFKGIRQFHMWGAS